MKEDPFGPIVVTDAEQLQRIPVHDAWFDPGEVVHDRSSRTLTLRFAQEPFGPDKVSEPQLVRRGRLTKEYRVPYRDWLLVVHDVLEVQADDGWGDMGMLDELGFDGRRLSIESNDTMTVTVGALLVEARQLPDSISWIRRRILPLGLINDTPWS